MTRDEEQDTRNKTERLLNAATDHIGDTHEQPTDPRAWDHLLAYCPAGVLFNRLVSKIDFDSMNPRTFSLAELHGAIDGARWPK